MKKSVLFLAGCFLASANYNALSHDFSDKVYGKANVSIGYQFQAIGNSAIKDRIKQAEDSGNLMNYNYHALTFGIGYDFYFKVLDFMHPFVGFDVEARVPVKNNVFEGAGNRPWPDSYWRLADFMSFDLKFGSKFVINKDHAVQLYGLFGMNLLTSTTSGTIKPVIVGTGLAGYAQASSTGATVIEPYVGLNVGTGLSYIYNVNSNVSIFTAVEYKYSYARNVKDENGLQESLNGETSFIYKTYAMHQVGVKFGVQF